MGNGFEEAAKLYQDMWQDTYNKVIENSLSSIATNPFANAQDNTKKTKSTKRKENQKRDNQNNAPKDNAPQDNAPWEKFFKGENFFKDFEKHAKSYNHMFSEVSKNITNHLFHPPKKPQEHHIDRRFHDHEWESNPYFQLIKGSYLMYCGWLEKFVRESQWYKQIKDNEAKNKIDFFVKFYLDSMAPTNYPFTNPEVLREITETNGKNLFKGLENLWQDQMSGLKVPALTDLTAFKVGENLATTDGDVIFENDVFQLLQYLPKRGKIYQVPILIIPPWINKYYIFDLQEDNSFIRWNLNAGRPVYVISWVNPDASKANLSLTDYLINGIDQAIKQITAVCKQPALNAVGFCVGGLALQIMLSYYQKTKNNCIKSATLLASPTDFSKMLDLSLFVDKKNISKIKDYLNQRGGLHGEEMRSIFANIRANDLIWPNYIRRYLLGKDLKPLDFLFWNNDITNIPSTMHFEYLKEFFAGNALMTPDKYKLKDVGIDISKITTPSFMVATQKDHIVPWQSAFAAFQKIPNSTFILGGSGHIAGIINPPANNKYGYWKAAENNLQANHNISPEEWMKNATAQEGSWWGEWERWIKPYMGKKTISSKNLNYQSLEKTPGKYALQKAPSLLPSSFPDFMDGFAQSPFCTAPMKAAIKEMQKK